MYMVTKMLTLKNGRLRDKERTTHQNMVEYGNAVAKNTYS